MNKPAVFLFVFIIFISGCVSIHSSEPETLTPVSVPTPDPTFPVGVAAQDLSPQTIGEAHSISLTNKSFSLYSERTIFHNGSVVRSTNITELVESDGTRLKTAVRESSGYSPTRGISSFQYYKNDTVRALQLQANDSRLYMSGTEVSKEFYFDPTHREWITRYLQSFDRAIRVSQPTAEGVALHGDSIRLSQTMPVPTSARDPRNGQLRAVVTPTGTVSSINVTYSATTQANRTVRIFHQIRIKNVGKTSFQPPRWIANSTVGISGVVGIVR